MAASQIMTRILEMSLQSRTQIRTNIKVAACIFKLLSQGYPCKTGRLFQTLSSYFSFVDGNPLLQSGNPDEAVNLLKAADKQNSFLTSSHRECFALPVLYPPSCKKSSPNKKSHKIQLFNYYKPFNLVHNTLLK